MRGGGGAKGAGFTVSVLGHDAPKTRQHFRAYSREDAEQALGVALSDIFWEAKRLSETLMCTSTRACDYVCMATTGLLMIAGVGVGPGILLSLGRGWLDACRTMCKACYAGGLQSKNSW